MSKIFISGLVNIETTLKIDSFPLNYYPVCYPFFGINSAPAGVGINLSSALRTLNDDVTLFSFAGNDVSSESICKYLESMGISTEYIIKDLNETCQSVIIYDNNGNRQIHCDLKNIQETDYDCEFLNEAIEKCDILCLTNINFSRKLLKKFHSCKKIIASDVHAISDIYDSYNADFMEYADILFFSHENVRSDIYEFIKSIYNKYHNKIIVCGMGSKGALMYRGESDSFTLSPAVNPRKVINTVGAGDSLFSAFIHFYSNGDCAETALNKAVFFAGWKIGENGASKGFLSNEAFNSLYFNQ